MLFLDIEFVETYVGKQYALDWKKILPKDLLEHLDKIGFNCLPDQSKIANERERLYLQMADTYSMMTNLARSLSVVDTSNKNGNISLFHMGLIFTMIDFEMGAMQESIDTMQNQLEQIVTLEVATEVKEVLKSVETLKIHNNLHEANAIQKKILAKLKQ